MHTGGLSSVKSPPVCHIRTLVSGLLAGQLAGQLESMVDSVVASSWPVIQLVSCFHSVPAPTAAGIRSEASKRETDLGSCRIDTDNLLIASGTLAGSRPLLAEIRDLESLLWLFAQCAVVR